MGECAGCLHWTENLYNYGKCSKIRNKIEVEVEYGWDGGYVDYIETEQDFGCVLFMERDET